MWWSLPYSIAGFFGIGYGPGSLSSAYRNVTPVFFCAGVTRLYGMPIGPPFHFPEPKSGWSPVPAPIVAMIAVEFAATGSESTRSFHGLSAGKSEQPASECGRIAASAARPPRASETRPAATSFTGGTLSARPAGRLARCGDFRGSVVHFGRARM
jgi:hypothetical protein